LKTIRKISLKPNKQTLDSLLALGLPPIVEAGPLWQYLKRPDVTLKQDGMKEGGPFSALSGFLPDETERAEIKAKYEGYIERQNKWIEQLEEIEEIPIEKEMDYSSISGLSMELRQKLDKVRPITFGQASRMAGMTPAALSVIMITLKTRAKNR
jgi:tRNA uridine 5-carboxymethylaminomethyl modification enzyme